MNRYDLINHYIEKYNFTSYLEIGTQLGKCIQEVKCDFKVGVDPEYNENVFNNCTQFNEMTSDEFFKINKDTFDIIFIDGLHEYNQVLKDFESSLNILNKHGIIIIHDINPIKEENQDPIYYEDDEIRIPHRMTWNGDVWKSWVSIKAFREDLEMVCYNFDEGCGVIKHGVQELIVLDKPFKEITYNDLEKNRVYYLNLQKWECEK